MSGSRSLAVVSLTVALVVAGSAGAASVTKPRAGKYKVTTSAFNLVESGGFTVNKRRTSISGLRMVPGSGANKECGTAAIKIARRLTLTKATRAGSSVWIVGRNAPKVSDGVAPIKVPATVGGEAVTGTLEMTFAEGRSRGSAQLELPSCQQFFDFSK